MMTEGYIPQASDNISAESSGGHSLRNFRVGELLHTRVSWEAMGIAKGKLPSTMIIDQHGNETHPYMTMNGVIIDEHSSEVKTWMKQILIFLRRQCFRHLQ